MGAMNRLSLLLAVSLLAGGCPGEISDGAPGAEAGILPDRGVAADRSVTAKDKGATPTKDKGTLPPKKDKGAPSVVLPPLKGSSGGKGGASSSSGSLQNAKGTSYIIITPSGYSASTPHPLLMVISGTEGYQVMAQNLRSVASYAGLTGMIFAVLDGKATYNNGQAGADVLDHVRSRYNVENDRTYLLSESAGTRAGLQLGLNLRQSYFAAYWANDVNASATPARKAAQLGFKPWGNAGPGGQYTLANSIVAGMKAAGYRLPAQAPYAGAGAGQHGSTQQFLAAVKFFVGKSR